MLKLTSYGAADGVTGSCHLLDIADTTRVLLDCGVFQGRRSERDRNNPPFPFDPSSIDALLVSHAHLDHIGRIPLLYKEGFRGRILSTRATYDLARISMLDSARIMDSDATRANRRQQPGDPLVTPLYDEQDVLDVIDLWQDTVGYQEPRSIQDALQVTMHDAGHILGSAFLELECEIGTRRATLLFSGDLGNVDKPIIQDPTLPPRADFVLMESTYGNRDHRPFEASKKELIAIVNQTIEGQGNVLIPSFAMERSQELLYVLHEAIVAGQIPSHTTIYLDSPMAIDATRIFTRHPDCYDAETVALAREGLNPFQFKNLHYTRHTQDSMRINDHRSGAIIIAGSGMLTGGRILHHIKHNIHRPECALIFCGYQAEGTLGRRMLEGSDEVRIYGKSYPVHLQLHTINGFSGHAGQQTLTQWAEATRAPHIALVHGEQHVKRDFASHLSKTIDSSRQIDIMPFARTLDLSSILHTSRA